MSGVIFAFCAPPFLLALWCAGATMWTHRRDFLRPSRPLRLETELRLAPIDALWLRSGTAAMGTFCGLLTVLFWGWWISLSLLDIKSVDPIAWLPAKGENAWDLTFSTEDLIAPLVFCLVLDGIYFVFWFNKWRYYSGKENAPITHGGLRWWKESLGCYLVVLSLFYFGTALCGWPSRAAAMRELEIQMVRGDLPR